MESLGDAFKEVLRANTKEQRTTNFEKGDYKDDEGFLRCCICHERKEFDLEFPDGEVMRVPVLCKCGVRKRDEEAERKNLAEKVERIKMLKANSLMDRKFMESTFDSLVVNQDNVKQVKICRRYAEKFEELRKKNQGLLLFGTVGSGKTHLACCIGNYVMDNLRAVIATSLVKILQNADLLKDDGFVRQMSMADLLILDDLGAERGTDFALETVYNVIDSRYRTGKPMIVTTNMTLAEMQNPADIRYKRIYDRIFEVCYPVEFTGKSWRMREAATRFDAMKKLLEE
ncbi:MAG: ATP-binding protein [Clostridia bacterium]|nr:ATP-binding protein [Clostridia bacterium]